MHAGDTGLTSLAHSVAEVALVAGGVTALTGEAMLAGLARSVTRITRVATPVALHAEDTGLTGVAVYLTTDAPPADARYA